MKRVPVPDELKPRETKHHKVSVPGPSELGKGEAAPRGSRRRAPRAGCGPASSPGVGASRAEVRPGSAPRGQRVTRVMDRARTIGNGAVDSLAGVGYGRALMLGTLLMLASPRRRSPLVGLILSPSGARRLAPGPGLRVSSQPANRLSAAVSAGRRRVTLAFGRAIVLRLASQPAPTACSAPPAQAPPPLRGAQLPATVGARLGVEIRASSPRRPCALLRGRPHHGLTCSACGGTLLSERPSVGDVIREINGTVIDGMATLIGLWTRLRSERRSGSRRARGRLTILSLTLSRPRAPPQPWRNPDLDNAAGL